MIKKYKPIIDALEKIVSEHNYGQEALDYYRKLIEKYK